MTSVVSAGTTDRIATRTLFNVLRAGSGTRDRYSSTVLGAALLFARKLRLSDELVFLIGTIVTFCRAALWVVLKRARLRAVPYVLDMLGASEGWSPAELSSRKDDNSSLHTQVVMQAQM